MVEYYLARGAVFPFVVPSVVLFVVLLFGNCLCNTLKYKALRADFVVLSVVPLAFRLVFR